MFKVGDYFKSTRYGLGIILDYEKHIDGRNWLIAREEFSGHIGANLGHFNIHQIKNKLNKSKLKITKHNICWWVTDEELNVHEYYEFKKNNKRW